jgi:hypothetical protein
MVCQQKTGEMYLVEHDNGDLVDHVKGALRYMYQSGKWKEEPEVVEGVGVTEHDILSWDSAHQGTEDFVSMLDDVLQDYKSASVEFRSELITKVENKVMMQKRRVFMKNRTTGLEEITGSALRGLIVRKLHTMMKSKSSLDHPEPGSPPTAKASSETTSEESSEKVFIDKVQDTDVFCSWPHHPGTVKYQGIIAQHMEKYTEATEMGTGGSYRVGGIITLIIQQIRDAGLRVVCRRQETALLYLAEHDNLRSVVRKSLRKMYESGKHEDKSSLMEHINAREHDILLFEPTHQGTKDFFVMLKNVSECYKKSKPHSGIRGKLIKRVADQIKTEQRRIFRKNQKTHILEELTGPQIQDLVVKKLQAIHTSGSSTDHSETIVEALEDNDVLLNNSRHSGARRCQSRITSLLEGYVTEGCVTDVSDPKEISSWIMDSIQDEFRYIEFTNDEVYVLARKDAVKIYVESVVKQHLTKEKSSFACVSPKDIILSDRSSVVLKEILEKNYDAYLNEKGILVKGLVSQLLDMEKRSFFPVGRW